VLVRFRKVCCILGIAALLYSVIFNINIVNADSSGVGNIPSDESERTSQDEDSEAEKIVYLTFDDGPSYKITGKLLDVLKEEEVKATFFVVGKEIRGREYILKRIHEEGHSIGLHTYSHNFKSIYKSNDNFIHEMKKTAYIVNDVLGVTPKAVRFPGGSARLLNEELMQELHNNGFKVYDWNVDLYDGVNPSFSPDKLIKNAKKAKGNQNERIILAHCNYNNINTCKALKGIIDYYKENGFDFRTIDDDTKEYYYKFRK
jgi:peptidoglycan/xylan/chitin deacetylase (PgdA/CDA1 family)